jgi:hypothetical protein
MANILGLALKINADATQLKLDPVERALQRLGTEAEKVTRVFGRFTSESEAAVRAQGQFASDLTALNAALKSGEITAKQYAAEFARLSKAAEDEAAALERAAAITARYEPETAKFARTQAELRQQLEAGRLTQETYNVALEDAARKLTAAERAALGLSARSQEIAKAGGQATLQFNELSGVFAALPGPLGNIAGRISGLSSASEGLSRVFSGGFSQGVSSVASSLSALVTPTTVAVAGIAGLGAAATGIVSGLTALEARVERLGNLANQLGVSFEFVQVLEEAGKRTGVSIESVAAATARLQRTLTGADEESKQATRALANLGLAIEDVQAKSQEEQIELIGQRIAAIEDPAKRTTAAIALFGRSGTQLLPFFNMLEKAAADFGRLGGAITEDEKNRIDQIGDAFDALSRVVTRLGEVVLVPFTEVVVGVTNALADITGVVVRVARVVGVVLEPALRTIGAVFQGLSFAAAAANSAFDSLFGTAASSADRASASAEKFRAEVQRPLVGGFASDFKRNMTDVNRLLGEASSLTRALAGEFSSRAGTATDQFRRRVAELQEQLSRVDPTGDAARRIAASIEFATERYRQQIEVIRQAAAARDSQIDKERGIADQLIEQLRVSRLFDGSDARAKAAEAVLAINAEIARTEFNLNRIRLERGEAEAEIARQRIADLREILVVQQDIAAGITEQAEADSRRINAIVAGAERRSEVEQNIAAIQREQTRILEEQGAAAFRSAEDFNRVAVESEAKLQQLSSLRAQQEQLLFQERQGFAEGFDKVFSAVGTNFARLAEQASDFGDAGAAAAARLQEGIAAAQEQARTGILRREAFEAEVARQQRLFEQELVNVKAVADERRRVNEFVDQQFLLARFGGDQQRLAAAQRVAEVEREIVRVQGEIQAARAAGNQEAVNAGIQRVGLLDQVAAKEQDIASGRRQLEESIATQRDQYLQQLQQQQQAAQQQQVAFLAEQQKAIEAEQARQLERVRELNTLGAGVIGGSDIRTAEGAAQFLQLAAGRQDPALIEARLQTRRLTEIRQGIGQLVNSFGLPVVQIGAGVG